MDDLSLQEMIEKYRQELMHFSKSNQSGENAPEENSYGDYEEDFHEEAVSVNSPVTVTDEDGAAGEITSLVGTNVNSYDAGRTEKEYDTYEDFLQDNPLTGSLRVQTFTGSETYPSAGAEVEIYKSIGGKDMLVDSGMTDISGIYEKSDLPAPDMSYSENFSDIQPFSTYTVKIVQDGYITIIVKNLPVFPGIQSMQTIELIPQNQNGQIDSPITINTQEPQDL